MSEVKSALDECYKALHANKAARKQAEIVIAEATKGIENQRITAINVLDLIIEYPEVEDEYLDVLKNVADMGIELVQMLLEANEVRVLLVASEEKIESDINYLTRLI